ncbi:DUF2750 domain-containing protein [Pseudarthrobacter sp. efr-133-R2A-89]|uniref:DUF2750 domain-containing protein n=1 Tax=Pseudarthrobacter sp. efr-133-R2A-89 TaxID=3040302 RepID=UPI00255555B1|nr:DUF2750 domain-containing protein [Pseudarthrobacter sp. efr-133-R2A-89]
MSTSAAHASAFYDESLLTGEVWALRDSTGFPAPLNADGKRSMPFWSLASRAEVIQSGVADYQGLELVKISMKEWQSRWLPGLAADGLLVGLNWSGPRATGYDAHPSEVVSSLAARTPSSGVKPI